MVILSLKDLPPHVAYTGYSCSEYRLLTPAPKRKPSGLHMGAVGLAYGGRRACIWGPAGRQLPAGVCSRRGPCVVFNTSVNTIRSVLDYAHIKKRIAFLWLIRVMIANR